MGGPIRYTPPVSEVAERYAPRCKVPIRVKGTEFRQCGQPVRWHVYETRPDTLRLLCDCHVLVYWQKPAFSDLIDAGLIRISPAEVPA